MARFTTRVELHDAYGGAYETLHAEIGKRGFTRTIDDGEVNEYQLPIGEYNLESELTSKQVCDLAVAAAKQTCTNHDLQEQPWVLVTKAADTRQWSGLKKVQ